MTKKLLIIDDSSVIRQMIKYSVEKEDIEITEAEDGFDGITKLDVTRFDLIITDLNMPNGNGIDVLEAAKMHKANKFTKVCILTTESEVKKKQEAKEKGANGFIVKPFDPKSLKAIIKKLIL